jgi:hypothetical protein
VASAEQSVRNPRLSPDRRWIAFDAFRPGESPTIYVAPFAMQPIPETAWLSVDRAASHPFWSADGRLLYYTPTGTNPLVRSAIRARPIAASGPADEPFAAYSSADMLMPAYFAGTAPLATPDQIVLVLGDFRGDVWIRTSVKTTAPQRLGDGGRVGTRGPAIRLSRTANAPSEHRRRGRRSGFACVRDRARSLIPTGHEVRGGTPRPPGAGSPR